MINQNHPYTKKRCDFILVSPSDEEVEGKYIVVFGELKSQTIDEENCTIQLVNSHIFFKYIINLVNEYHGEKTGKFFELRENIDIRFVVLTNSTSDNKFSTTNSMTDYPRKDDDIRIDVILVHDIGSFEKGENRDTDVIEKGVINYQDLLMPS